MGDDDEAAAGIQAAAAQLGVTPRTLRFYEDRGLIQPRRVGTARWYGRREIARMRLILRGKRLGFSLRDIAEFLDLYDVDPDQQEQMRTLADRCRARIVDLQAQRDALTQTLTELEAIEQQARDHVAARPNS